MQQSLVDRLRGELHFRAFERARLEDELKHLPERAAHADRAAKLIEMIWFEHRFYGRIEQLIHQVKAFNPEQPRDEQGRWTDGGGIDAQLMPQASEQQASSGYSFGRLIAEYETGDGRRCVYQFDFATIVTPGADRLGCSKFIPSSAATHGGYLNDN